MHGGSGQRNILCLRAWLATAYAQAHALFLLKGLPPRGPRREALQRALSVAMNLTHNNAAGAAAVVHAKGLEVAAGILDSVLGPPEDEPALVAIADRCAAGLLLLLY